MDQQNQRSTTREERRSMALAALIISIVAMFCAFIAGWRTFSIFISGIAFIVSVFVLTKVRHAGPSKTMSLLALVIALIAAALSIYLLSSAKAEQDASVEIPAELHDSAALSPDDGTLDRLKNSMDSSQTQD